MTFSLHSDTFSTAKGILQQIMKNLSLLQAIIEEAEVPKFLNKSD